MDSCAAAATALRIGLPMMRVMVGGYRSGGVWTRLWRVPRGDKIFMVGLPLCDKQAVNLRVCVLRLCLLRPEIQRLIFPGPTIQV